MPGKMDWDSPIENDGEGFELLPEGTIVEFQVIVFEKARSSKGDPMAKLQLSLFDGDVFGRAYENLVLNQACEWKLCQFFTAIGQRKHGETLVPKWNKVETATGYAEVGVEKYKKDNGRGAEVEKNFIKRFLEPEAGEKMFKEASSEGGSTEPEADDELKMD